LGEETGYGGKEREWEDELEEFCNEGECYAADEGEDGRDCGYGHGSVAKGNKWCQQGVGRDLREIENIPTSRLSTLNQGRVHGRLPAYEQTLSVTEPWLNICTYVFLGVLQSFYHNCKF
jgi:hypothetical protein